MQLLEEAIAGGHKVLLFSQFTSMLRLIADKLQQAGHRYYLLQGSTPTLRRTEMVQAFNADDTPVMLVSLKAGGTGLNLTGADVVIHYDPWWNFAAQNQATDRAHRIGQTRQVTVIRLIASHSIEEKIQALQEAKRELADSIIGSEGGSIMNMSAAELLELLS
jgi:SNF2 family DNA or RNA helicase